MADLASQPTSVQTVYNWYREGKLEVNRRYQRKLVWTLEEKQKLIDSLLRKYPLPAILLAERQETVGKFEIIDGLQRLHSIVSFIEHAYATIDGSYFDVQEFASAKRYSDLFDVLDGVKKISPKEVSVILDYALPMSIMRNATEKEITDVFDRINTYGHRLSDQERRQAGVETEFSKFVRELSCEIRGDVSKQTLELFDMPSISIDLPKSKYGYSVQAEDVFWVDQGILRSTDLRDSLDEQCVADISACVVNGEPIDRSKDALDQVYDSESEESKAIEAALGVYGKERLSDEFKYCIDEIKKVCASSDQKLRSIIFSQKNTNAFPSVFAVIFLAFHDIFINRSKIIADYKGINKSIINIVDRLNTGRKATSPKERQENVDVVVGMIEKHLVNAKGDELKKIIYNDHSVVDIENIVRRSIIELPNYELKQGFVRLNDKRDVDLSVFDQVIHTICAIANIGPTSSGKVLIGVSDKDADTRRIVELDKIKPREIGGRSIVGVFRESDVLGISREDYLRQWRDAIANSHLSEPLKQAVLAHIDLNNYYDLGVVVISVPSQKAISSVGEEIFFRSGDQTVKASPLAVADIAKRF